MLSNVMSLVPKVDEVREFISRNSVEVAFITETWLKESVSDTVVNIPGFSLIRKDRKSDAHGGVCTYIKESNIKYKQIDDLNCCEEHEILWLYLSSCPAKSGLSTFTLRNRFP